MQQGRNCRPWRNMDDAERLAALRDAETRLWLCEGRVAGDHATLVVGWSSVIRLLAKECLDCETPPEAIAEAESWLLRDAGQWSFGPDGTACWSVEFGGGGWAVTMVTDDAVVTFHPFAARH